MVRMHVKLRPAGVNPDLAFWGLVIIWETGYLPLRRAMTWRFVRTAFRRRREFLLQLDGLLGGSGSIMQRLSRGFATPD
jgi:hypothetical protein